MPSGSRHEQRLTLIQGRLDRGEPVDAAKIPTGYSIAYTETGRACIVRDQVDALAPAPTPTASTDQQPLQPPPVQLPASSKAALTIPPLPQPKTPGICELPSHTRPKSSVSFLCPSAQPYVTPNLSWTPNLWNQTFPDSVQVPPRALEVPPSVFLNKNTVGAERSRTPPRNPSSSSSSSCVKVDPKVKAEVEALPKLRFVKEEVTDAVLPSVFSSQSASSRGNNPEDIWSYFGSSSRPQVLSGQVSADVATLVEIQDQWSRVIPPLIQARSLLIRLFKRKPRLQRKSLVHSSTHARSHSTSFLALR